MAGKKVSRLQRKPEEVEIEIEENGEKVTEKLIITPLKVKNVDLINKLGSSNETDAFQATKDILKLKLIENGYDEPTDEELIEVDWEYADKILTAVMNLNNVDIDEKKMKFVEDIKKKQKAAGIIK